MPEMPEVETIRRGLNATVRLDQATIAGIGNIYADECLHLARIDPRTPTASLTASQLRRLHQAIRVILRDAVDHFGMSFPEFIDVGRHRDSYLDHARLFGRQGEPCAVCGTRIERIRVAGRGTNYCPHCQRSATSPPPRQGHGRSASKTAWK